MGILELYEDVVRDAERFLESRRDTGEGVGDWSEDADCDGDVNTVRNEI